MDKFCLQPFGHPIIVIELQQSCIHYSDTKVNKYREYFQHERKGNKENK